MSEESQGDEMDSEIAKEKRRDGKFDPREELSHQLELARIPRLFGPAGEVANILLSRIGQSSLDFEDVARELSISREDLHRKLISQGIRFDELQDLIRRNYAINAVLFRNESVNEICKALDFPDKSSLTLAFKRWTGFSPRAFGRLFRDYI